MSEEKKAETEPIADVPSSLTVTNEVPNSSSAATASSSSTKPEMSEKFSGELSPSVPVESQAMPTNQRFAVPSFIARSLEQIIAPRADSASEIAFSFPLSTLRMPANASNQGTAVNLPLGTTTADTTPHSTPSPVTTSGMTVCVTLVHI